jgi:hypothetical protein
MNMRVVSLILVCSLLAALPMDLVAKSPNRRPRKKQKLRLSAAVKARDSEPADPLRCWCVSCALYSSISPTPIMGPSSCLVTAMRPSRAFEWLHG